MVSEVPGQIMNDSLYFHSTKTILAAKFPSISDTQTISAVLQRNMLFCTTEPRYTQIAK